MKTFFSVLLASSILFWGCQKENVNFLAEKESINQSKGYIDFNLVSSPAMNPLNPYDHIGLLHNIVLDSLRNYVKQTGDTTRKGRSAYLSGYFFKHRSIDIRVEDDRQLEVRLMRDYKSVLLGLDLSQKGEQLMNALTQAVDSIKSAAEFESFASKIITTENSILSAKLPGLEKKYLLVTAAVMRHSGYYWMKEFKENDSKQMKRGVLGFLRKVAGVITAIAADATTAAWHVVKGSDLDYMVIEAVWMSDVCGGYTGGWYGT